MFFTRLVAKKSVWARFSISPRLALEKSSIIGMKITENIINVYFFPRAMRPYTTPVANNIALPRNVDKPAQRNIAGRDILKKVNKEINMMILLWNNKTLVYTYNM